MWMLFVASTLVTIWPPGMGIRQPAWMADHNFLCSRNLRKFNVAVWQSWRYNRLQSHLGNML